MTIPPDVLKLRTCGVRAAAFLLLVLSVATRGSAAPAFPLRYSANARYLVDQAGVPFPILGRAAWFVTSLAPTDWRMFVDDTVSRGYTAIEFHAINHDPRGNHPPFDGGGHAPFLMRLNGAAWNGSLSYTNAAVEAADFTTPNDEYWNQVDALLAYCESKGVLVFFFPAYAGVNGGDQGWMQEMTANGAARMESYGAWLAARYAKRGNLVWMMAGDLGSFTAVQERAESGLLAGVRAASAGRMMLFSAEWATESVATDQQTFGPAMTLNGAYSWYGNVPTVARKAYAHSPAEPAFLLEEPYDQEGPDGNNVNPNATLPVRRFQWWGWLSAIGGCVSGNGYVWPFRPQWRSHLDTSGSRDTARLNAFIRSIEWYRLVPSGLSGMRSIVTAGGSSSATSFIDGVIAWLRQLTNRVTTGDPPGQVSAAATPEGTLMVAYVPPAHVGAITIDMEVMAAPARGRWFDPTNGKYVAIDSGLANIGQHTFETPGRNGQGDTDWVLVLDVSQPPVRRTASD